MDLSSFYLKSTTGLWVCVRKGSRSVGDAITFGSFDCAACERRKLLRSDDRVVGFGAAILDSLLHHYLHAYSHPRRIFRASRQVLARHLHANGHRVTVLSRNPQPAQWRTSAWDAINPGPWVDRAQPADVVIHLSGRSVNCRYNAENRRAIYDSRVLPTLLLGRLIAASPTPPRVWLMLPAPRTIATPSTNPMKNSPAFPLTFPPSALPAASMSPATCPKRGLFRRRHRQAGESALAARRHATHPQTGSAPPWSCRRMRAASSLSSRSSRASASAARKVPARNCHRIHDLDFCRAVDLLLAQPEITAETAGVVNMCAPNPMPNRDFMRTLRQAWNQAIGLPAWTWMLELGAIPCARKRSLSSNPAASSPACCSRRF